MSDTTQQSGMLFAGTFYFSFQAADGSWLPAVQVETDKFAVTTPADKKQAVSKKRENYGMAHTTSFVPKPMEFEVSMTEVTRALLAVQLSGELNPLTTAGGAFADVPVVAALGAWVDIGHKNIAAAGFSVKNDAGTTTYEEGTHYEVNRRLGKLRAIPGGTITEGQPLKLTGTAQATTGYRIDAGKKTRHVMRIEGDCVNTVSGEDAELFAVQAVVTSDQAYDFLQSDLAVLTLKGNLEVPAGTSQSALVVEYRKPA